MIGRVRRLRELTPDKWRIRGSSQKSAARLSAGVGSPAGEEEVREEAGDLPGFAKDTTVFPVFVGFAAVLACIAWHLHNLSLAAEAAGAAK